jgi:hypothetical protein
VSEAELSSDFAPLAFEEELEDKFLQRRMMEAAVATNWKAPLDGRVRTDYDRNSERTKRRKRAKVSDMARYAVVLICSLSESASLTS